MRGSKSGCGHVYKFTDFPLSVGVHKHEERYHTDGRSYGLTILRKMHRLLCRWGKRR